jgi:hypothetical protein
MDISSSRRRPSGNSSGKSTASRYRCCRSDSLSNIDGFGKHADRVLGSGDVVSDVCSLHFCGLECYCCEVNFCFCGVAFCAWV